MSEAQSEAAMLLKQHRNERSRKANGSQMSHRGLAPGDESLFGDQARPALRQATSDLCWLLSRGYAEVAALKLVGDRYDLTARQRSAVGRAVCTDNALSHRLAHMISPSNI